MGADNLKLFSVVLTSLALFGGQVPEPYSVYPTVQSI
ncbi:hypothetical protein EYZ11_004528 [Aspergillus tanneri]|uniref:Uncharacterized protein n=1 Tax=Aspergillus tanneri TaxID=1220188 RepID=A0A4S3JR62_9EURO|nr:hypothetical protein EYZ11_004528 [Aspergillus tanneri]